MKRLVLAVCAALLGLSLLVGPASVHAEERTPDPQVLALVPASSPATCSYRVGTTYNGVTLQGATQPCPAGALQQTVPVPLSVAKSHRWSYLTLAQLARNARSLPAATAAAFMPTPVNCPVVSASPQVSPACGGGGGGGGSPCNYFRSLWVTAHFADGASFSTNVAYTVNCGVLQLNWSQIGQFGGYTDHYQLAYVDYGVIGIGAFWQMIPQRSYSLQTYGRWFKPGGNFTMIVRSVNYWLDWDVINLGSLR